MRNLNYRVCDLYTWQSFFYLDVLRGARVGFTQGLAMLARDGGQNLENGSQAQVRNWSIFMRTPGIERQLVLKFTLAWLIRPSKIVYDPVSRWLKHLCGPGETFI